jgi:type II secretory pathway pseudopilin PulG
VSALAIIVIVVIVLLAILIAGGFWATARHSRREQSELRAELREADQALAQARADDRGWDRDALEAAARDAFAARSPATVRELMLVLVVDRPGTDEDQAVFRVVTDAGSEDIVLSRRGDAWAPPAGA